MRLKYLILPAIFFFAGCSNINGVDTNTQNKAICMQEPSWVFNPPVKKDTIYGIGIAPENFNGPQAQRKSAIAKAINEIASELETTVNSQTITEAMVYNKNASTYLHNVSFQTVQGKKVSAKIIKSCKNLTTGNLYILMEAQR